MLSLGSRSLSLLCLLINLDLFSIEATTVDERNYCTKGPCRVEKDKLRFFFVGDTGGFPMPPFWRTWAQTTVAKTMSQIADKKPVDFVLNAGDNIYFMGVNDPIDSRFEDSFEYPYSYKSLKDKNWYMTGGNHDHFGTIEAQINYTKRSNMWTYPNKYYKVSYVLKDGTTIDIVVIDTIVLCGNTKDIQGATNIVTFLASYWWQAIFDDPPGPKDLKETEKQWKWIEEQLAESTADYLFVMGHYPVYSMCDHGPTTCLIERLRPLFKRYAVSAYLSGHDHNLQHLIETVKNDSWDANHTVHYFVSGAGSRLDSETNHLNAIPKNSLQYYYPNNTWNIWFFTSFIHNVLGLSHGGFTSVDLTRESAKFYFHGGGSEKVESTAEVKPRTAKQKPKKAIIPETQLERPKVDESKEGERRRTRRASKEVREKKADKKVPPVLCGFPHGDCPKGQVCNCMYRALYCYCDTLRQSI